MLSFHSPSILAVLGVCGGVASGKSSACAFLASADARVLHVDADALALFEASLSSTAPGAAAAQDRVRAGARGRPGRRRRGPAARSRRQGHLAVHQALLE